MKRLAATLAALMLGPGLSLHAMTVEPHGTAVFASGPVEDDLRKFEEALAQPGINTVVFVNSPGGDLWTGLRVGRLIARKGLNTVAAGSCMSACSIMFMGGRERRYAGAFRPNLTMVGIHGAHNKETKQLDPQLQPQIAAFYKQQMGERYNRGIVNQALYDMDDAQAFLRVPDPARSSTVPPWHCRSGQTPRQSCTEHPGQDALSLGIATHPELVTLTLPPAFRVAQKVLGHELTQPVASIPDMLAEIGQRQCGKSETCQSLLNQWAEYEEHRAVATRVGGRGFGAAFNRDTPVSAMMGAIFSCNHLRGQPTQLCEAENVNGYDVRHLYREAEQGHQDALARLAPPPEKFYANEEFGGGFTPAGGYRVHKVTDITPRTLDGVRTVGTQELARMIKSDRPPRVIDVGGGANDVLPGAVTLLFGGNAFDDPKTEESYQQRFAALLRLLAPQSDHPVVFYCASRNCWQSANAALRAAKLGYAQVLWYRGGMESWKAAGLPTAPIVVRAVAN